MYDEGDDDVDVYDDYDEDDDDDDYACVTNQRISVGPLLKCFTQSPNCPIGRC